MKNYISFFSTIVYRLEPNTDRFAIHQRIPTKGAVGISHFTVGAEFYLVIANSRGNAGDKLDKNIITYRWDRTTKTFRVHQEMTQLYPNRINIFQYNGESKCFYFSFENLQKNEFLLKLPK
jgi:hypothetical protein